ncbi:RIMS binding protein 2 [Homo sapiens]|uniref:RIMS binding protein 2 n=1 Tax=Homo sapiens TaxID=9606 RepID=A0A2U3TZP8_HUMAN|nr:RIMS binding protein 2 [Homo sapiens]KAI4068965.1 RIMS binding protein 2 [Homo sapiens]
MREAAERRQQLQLEHDQALAVLSAKQQEIDLLQKPQKTNLQCPHFRKCPMLSQLTMTFVSTLGFKRQKTQTGNCFCAHH